MAINVRKCLIQNSSELRVVQSVRVAWFHQTYLGICIDELILHESSFVVESHFGLKVIVYEAFSIGIFILHQILLVWEVLLSCERRARRGPERGGRIAFLAVEAILELAIIAKSIVLPHGGQFFWLW